VRANNFNGRNLTKLYQGVWLVAGVITWTLILQGVPPTKFEMAKTSKIQRDFRQLSTLIANISGMARRKKIWKALDQLHFIPYWVKKIWWTLVH